MHFVFRQITDSTHCTFRLLFGCMHTSVGQIVRKPPQIDTGHLRRVEDNAPYHRRRILNNAPYHRRRILDNTSCHRKRIFTFAFYRHRRIVTFAIYRNWRIINRACYRSRRISNRAPRRFRRIESEKHPPEIRRRNAIVRHRRPEHLRNARIKERRENRCRFRLCGKTIRTSEWCIQKHRLNFRQTLHHPPPSFL